VTYQYIGAPHVTARCSSLTGSAFKDLSWLSGILALAATVFLWRPPRRRKRRTSVSSATSYQTYIQQTKMFIPFLF